MKKIKQNKFVKLILRAIDVCVGLYMPRRIRWKEEPFQKATNLEWRIGWFSIALVPLLFLSLAVKPVRSLFDSFIHYTDHHSTVWLYVGFMGMGFLLIYSIYYLAPRTPLYISIPVAIVSWIYCVWLLGFHSEEVLHSSSNW